MNPQVCALLFGRTTSLQKLRVAPQVATEDNYHLRSLRCGLDQMGFHCLIVRLGQCMHLGV